MYCLRNLETRSPKSCCMVDSSWELREKLHFASLLACSLCISWLVSGILPWVPHCFPSVCVCPNFSPFHKEITHMGIVNSFPPDHLQRLYFQVSSQSWILGHFWWEMIQPVPAYKFLGDPGSNSWAMLCHQYSPSHTKTFSLRNLLCNHHELLTMNHGHAHTCHLGLCIFWALCLEPSSTMNWVNSFP